MPPNIRKESSLKNLPDTSDPSVSFQIPADSSSAEFLLADTSDLDFLRGVGGTSFATIAPTPARGPLMKLSGVTPKAGSFASPPRSPSPVPSTQWSTDIAPSRFSRQGSVKAKRTARTPSRLKELAFDEPTIFEERLESLRAEVKTLQDDYDITMHMEPPTISQCSVIPIGNNTAATSPTVNPRSTISNPRTEGHHNVKHASRSRIPVSAGDSPPSAEPAAQSSSWSSMAGGASIDAELYVPSAVMGLDTIVTSDISQNARLSTGSMAERLVSYGQNFMSSIGVYNPKPEGSFTTDTGPVVAKTGLHVVSQPPPAARIAHSRSPSNIRSRNSYLFRLSDISPQKRETETSTSSHLSTARRELSPMRLANKRPATEDPPSRQHSGSKKGKMLSISAGSSSQVLQPSTRKNHAHVGVPISRDSRWPTSNFPSARTKYKPKLTSHRKMPSGSAVSQSSNLHRTKTINEEKGKRVVGREALPTVRSRPSQSRVLGTSHIRSNDRKVDEKKPMILERSGPCRAGLVSSLEKTGVTLPPANLTKPVAFTFRVDSRIEARKEEKPTASEQGRVVNMHRQRHPIPDFKVLHEAYPVSLACRKYVPIIPAPPIMLHTEIRAKEREKFDEMIRMKEEEMEREKEDRRRQQEAEEEREIKELRRRAIPKANEVPDWYADMPKRGGGVRGSG